MRSFLFTLVAMLTFVFPTLAQEMQTPVAPESAATAKFLIGTWKVDLRPTPDVDAHYQEFVASSIDGNAFKGSFYGTEIHHGRINSDWDGVHFAVVTNDGSGDYNTSGVLKGGKLCGTTHSLGREFLAVWTAELTR